MNLDFLPLAITMRVEPGIMADVVLITAPRPVKVSAAFVLGVAIATTIGVLVALALASVLGESVSLGSPSSNGSLGHIIQYLMVGLLIFLAVKSYLGRETAEPPRWLGALQNADPRRAFTTGLLLIWVMPSDLIIMLTVGVNLAHNGVSPVAALPFVAATALVAALPLLAYLLFRRRAKLLGTHGRWIPACARTGEHK
jgi:threonine/homoserine/homoserine lactone efflux protein